MEKLYFAQKAFILREGKVLLVRKSLLAPVHPGKWEVPGGRLEPGEDLTAHLRREVFEETGITAVAVEPFYLWDWYLPDGSRVVAAAVLCRAEGTEVTLTHQVAGDDLTQFAWVDVQELPRWDLIPNMAPVIRAFLEKYGSCI